MKDPLRIQKTFDPNTFYTKPYVKRVEKPWGYEIIYTRDDAPATGKILHIEKGGVLSTQFHDEKIETMCAISGKAILSLSNKQNEIEEVEMELYKGYQINTGQIHSIRAQETCDILESSMPETGNTYRIEDTYGRDTETEEMRKLPNRGWENE